MPGTIPAARQHLIDAIAGARAQAARPRRPCRSRDVRAGLLPRRRTRTTCAAARSRRARRSRRRPPARSARCARRPSRWCASSIPSAGAATAGVAAHHRRGRHRRHAVPGRFAGDGAERLRPVDPHDGPPGAARRARPRAAACCGIGRAGGRHGAWSPGSTSRSTAHADPARLEARARAHPRACSTTCASPSRDWPAMRTARRDRSRERARPACPASPRRRAAEAGEFLDWLADNHFTFLGYREYRLERGAARGPAGAGRRARASACCAPARAGRGRKPTDADAARLRRKAREAALLVVTKANSVSTVHRATYLDYVGVKTFDSRGHVTGERRFIGLFTSEHLQHEPARDPAAAPQGAARHRPLSASRR